MLTKKHLKDADGNFKDWPKLYKGLISPDEWKAFVAKRKSKAFQVILIY
jgi:hypothetical protein